MTATSNVTAAAAKERIASWLSKWVARVEQDWGADRDQEREVERKKGNPKFIPRSWVLDEIIQRVEHKKERDVIERAIHMAENPFEDSWGGDEKEEARWCGDVPRQGRMMQ